MSKEFRSLPDLELPTSEEEWNTPLPLGPADVNYGKLPNGIT